MSYEYDITITGQRGGCMTWAESHERAELEADVRLAAERFYHSSRCCFRKLSDDDLIEIAAFLNNYMRVLNDPAGKKYVDFPGTGCP